MKVTAFGIAQRFIGVKEVPGQKDNPLILAMLKLDGEWPEHDEVAWCSAYMNFVCWLLRLPRSKSLAARSWLNVGTPVDIEDARPAFDVVVLSRGQNPAHGHVGFYAGVQRNDVLLLSGNTSNQVCVAPFEKGRILGVRRLHG